MAENSFTIHGLFYPATFTPIVERAWAITMGGFGIGYDQATEVQPAPDKDYVGGPLSIFLEFGAPGAVPLGIWGRSIGTGFIA
jgi:hypothetical protein